MGSTDLLAYCNKIFHYFITPGSTVQDAPIGIIIALFFALVSHFFVRIYIRKLLRTEHLGKKLLVKNAVKTGFFRWLYYLAPILTIEFFFSFYDLGLQTKILNIVDRLLDTCLFLFLFIIALRFISLLKKTFILADTPRERVLRGYFQVAQITVIVVGSIIGICLILEEPPWKILSGLGAIAAVVLFVFKDTILSAIANVQIEFNDLIRVGDWIEVRDYDADGTIVEIKFHTVKVQNWDQSVVYIPIYKFMEGSFKNWRGIREGSARRIKTSVLIDADSVVFCKDDLLGKLQKVPFMQASISNHEEKVHAFDGYSWTNLGLFRVYLKAYFQNNLNIRQDMPCMVRQLAPTKDGTPMEIYVFTSEIEWLSYENIQAELFDHVLAAMQVFGLKTVTLKTKNK